MSQESPSTRPARRPVSISDCLPRLRQARGMSQVDLAVRLHQVSGNDSITREAVSRWERGKRIPGPYWRGWLGRVLDVPVPVLEHAATSARRIRAVRAVDPVVTIPE
ncbi:helix-turn-helix transcriptional regulator [Actinokineospora enzanensis]|uniref:helix-turn-helix transcriptional regulator n=1 Tax=Actinokineospora enzanensis TaxID=155975 RepID=UPI0009FF2B1C|nr:helix-turn-helix transcriptional regulator [Actinokineospora enzanensis]